MKKSTSVIRFFDTHRWLLSDPRFEKEAALRLGIAHRTLAASKAKAARARAALVRRKAQAERKRLLASFERSPQKAICHVFGSYCGEALRVARCESGYSVNAQNGQYLGLFQMGIERAPALRPRRVRARAGPGGVPLLRALGPRLEPLVVQAVVLSSPHETCAKCGTRAAGRVPTDARSLVVDRSCPSGGSLTA